MTRETLWLIVGFAGQAVFTGRFVLQWLYSEFKRRSVIPVGFWYLSMLGSALLLTYAIYARTRYSSSAKASAFWFTCATCS